MEYYWHSSEYRTVLEHKQCLAGPVRAVNKPDFYKQRGARYHNGVPGSNPKIGSHCSRSLLNVNANV